jgi:hypothetical protein
MSRTGIGRRIGAGRAEARALAAACVLAAALLAWGGLPVAHAMPTGPDAPADPEQIATWQGITLAGATCGGPPDGSGRRTPYKYYLNPGRSPEAGILFMLSGGGACMKEGRPPGGVTGIAAQLYCMSFTNFTDQYFNDTTFLLDVIASTVIPYFRRGEAGNPFRDWTYVALPYCTGDVHVGRMTEAYDYDPAPDATFAVLHRGGLNVAAVLADVAARVPGERPVVLTGMSAGGLGAIFNYPVFVARWPRTTLLPDAGIVPPAPASLMLREGQRVADRWGARSMLPPYCPDDACLGDTLHLLAAHAAAHDGRDGRPWRPFGLLQGQQDGTLSAYLEISRCSYQQALRRGLDEVGDNVRVFVPATDRHVFSNASPLEAAFRSQGGVEAIAWFEAVGAARAPGDLPASAIDPWMPCNPGFLPLVGIW